MSSLLDFDAEHHDRLSRALMEDARALSRTAHRIGEHLENPVLDGADARRLRAAWLAHRGNLERLERELEMTARAVRRQLDRQNTIGQLEHQ